MSTAGERVKLVACACGSCKLLIDPRGGRRYAPGHRQRGYRRRVKAAAQAQGVPAAVSFATLNGSTDTGGRNGDAQAPPQPVQRRRSGRQVSYQKAVRVLAVQLYLWDAAKTMDAAMSLADTIMRDALPERQRRDRAS